MRSHDSEQVAYARGVVARMWSQPASVRVTRRPGRSSGEQLLAEWFLLPNPNSPTLLVPSGVPQAASMLQRHGNKALPRIGRATLARAVRSGLLGHLPAVRLQVTRSVPGSQQSRSAASILTEVTGARHCGLILGTPRPNRKPVAQLFAVDGSTVAFGKIGVDAFTSTLVRTEAANLRIVRAAQPRSLDVPEVLHLESVDGLDLLVLSPMASSQQRRAATVPMSAMAELAHLLGVSTQVLETSPFLLRLADLAEAASGQPGSAETRALLTRVADRWGTRFVDFGCWHGDWAPWNMGVSQNRVQIWDWERFSSDVPVGFDPIHFSAQRVRHERDDTSQREAELVSQVPALLAQMDSPNNAQEPTLLLVLYLLEISSRFVEMSRGAAGSSLHPRARWALEFASRLMGERG